MDGDGPRFGAMIGLVAVVVATCDSGVLRHRVRARVGSFCRLPPVHSRVSMGSNSPCSALKTSGLVTGRQSAAAVPDRDLARAGLLDLQRARRRIADPMLVACATAASLFPFLGTIVYAIVRPPEFLADVRERELEMRGRRGAARQAEQQHCQHCGFENEKTFLRCPSCLRRLKEPCTVCGARSTRAGSSARTARPRSARRAEGVGRAAPLGRGRRATRPPRAASAAAPGSDAGPANTLPPGATAAPQRRRASGPGRPPDQPTVASPLNGCSAP